MGACMAGGMFWGGSVYAWGHVWWWGMHGKGACMVGKAAIAVGGTYPTGMHSCFYAVFSKNYAKQ